MNNQINNLDKIKTMSNLDYTFGIISFVLSAIAICLSEGYFSLFFIILTAIFFCDKRYWDMKYHLIKNLNKIMEVK